MVVRSLRTAILFTNSGQNRTRLADVAASVFQLLGVSKWDEQHSPNFPPDRHYFAGYAQNGSVAVYDCDEAQPPAYPFRVSVKESTRRLGSGRIEINASKLAKMLASGGFTVFIPHGTWYRTDWDGDGEIYVPDASLKPAAGGRGPALDG